MEHKLVVINLSGPDHPGITASLMREIKKNNGKIIDIGQSLTHGLLSLSLVIERPPQDGLSELEKSLSQTAKNLKMNLEIKSLINNPSINEFEQKYIISCVALDGISPDFLHDITNVLAKNNVNIQRIDNVSSDERLVSLDIATVDHDKNTNWEEIKTELLHISNTHNTNLATLKNNIWRNNKRLIIFDMDSTLIRSEVIVEMATDFGVGDQVHEITEKAMNGEIDFDESLRQRVALLKGMPKSSLKGILNKIELNEGVTEFISTVKSLGYKTAIISGGFNFFANAFKEKLHIDYAFSNELEFSEGLLTGKLKGSIVNAEKKAMLVELLAQQENINLEQVVAIGDGANDLQMLAKAGLGIAFHAREIVKLNAKQHMSHGPMTSILYFLGIPKQL